MKRGRHPGRGDVPGQFQIDWSRSAGNGSMLPTSTTPAVTSPPIVQYLKWDFATTFPQPTSEALDAGIVADEDITSEAIRAIHEEHARQLLTALHDLDMVLEARRRGVDPSTSKQPRTSAASERLQKFFVREPERLERWFQNLMGCYEQAFGTEAAEAFDNAIRARHAGIAVVTDHPLSPSAELSPDEACKFTRRQIRRHVNRTEPRRVPARLPVPKPLPAAVAAGHFGLDDDGTPVRPGANEVRAITESHAERLVELLDALSSTPVAERD